MRFAQNCVNLPSKSENILRYGCRLSHIQEDFFNSEIVILDSASEKIWRTKQPLTEEELFLITEKYPGSPWLDSLKDFDFKNLRKSRISERREFYLEEHFGYIRFAIEECSQYIAAQYVNTAGLSRCVLYLL